MRGQRFAGDEIHEPETTRVAVAHGRSVGEMEHDVLVLRLRSLLILKLAELKRLSVCLIDAEAAGHAEMHHQHLAVVEPRQQILGSPVERIDLSALQALSEVLRQRKAQVLAPLLHAGKAVTDQDPRKASSHRLDLRQFGHAGYRNAKRFPLRRNKSLKSGPALLASGGTAPKRPKRISAFRPWRRTQSRGSSTRSSPGSRAATT